jgi:hypothetical protein
VRQVRVLAALGVLFACVDTGPTAGVLQVSLTTPNSGADGAILFTISGPAALTTASPAAGLRLFSEPPFAAANRFVLTGTLVTGTVLTIGVADVGQVRSYTATVEQVAAATDQLRPLGGYALRVLP